MLVQIKQRIKQAFDNPTLERLDMNRKASLDSLQEAESDRKAIKDLAFDQEITYQNPILPGEVVITNPHDYPFLLRETTKEFNQRTGSTHEVDECTESQLAHELKHHVPGLDQKGLRIKYGVDVLRDPTTGQLGIRPKIVCEGKTTRSIHEDILSAPADLSGTDKRKLGIG